MTKTMEALPFFLREQVEKYQKTLTIKNEGKNVKDDRILQVIESHDGLI